MSPTPPYDFVIIGAGIAGASLAYRLSESHRVLVLEREEQPGYHSTGRSAAMFMEAYGTPQIQALTRASRAFYESPPEGFSEHPILSPRGCLYVGGPGHDALLRDAAGTPGVHPISVAEALERLPCLREDAIIGALYEPDARDLDVHALHQGYLRGLRQRGGELRCNVELLAASFADGAWTLQLSDGESLAAAQLVDAAGAWADFDDGWLLQRPGGAGDAAGEIEVEQEVLAELTLGLDAVAPHHLAQRRQAVPGKTDRHRGRIDVPGIRRAHSRMSI